MQPIPKHLLVAARGIEGQPAAVDLLRLSTAREGMIWDTVYKQAVPELRDAMDLAYLTGQRPEDVLSMRAADVVDGFLQVAQGKTTKKLRIRLSYGENLNQLGVLVERLLEQRRRWSVRNPYLIITERGMKVSAAMLRLRFDDVRLQAVKEALDNQDTTLAESVRQFQFRDIRPKAASEIDDLGGCKPVARAHGQADYRDGVQAGWRNC